MIKKYGIKNLAYYLNKYIEDHHRNNAVNFHCVIAQYYQGFRVIRSQILSNFFAIYGTDQPSSHLNLLVVK